MFGIHAIFGCLIFYFRLKVYFHEVIEQKKNVTHFVRINGITKTNTCGTHIVIFFEIF